MRVVNDATVPRPGWGRGVEGPISGRMRTPPHRHPWTPSEPSRFQVESPPDSLAFPITAGHTVAAGTQILALDIAGLS